MATRCSRTGNAAIDAWYVSSEDGCSWSVPVRVSSVSSDPAASAQNNLARQFWGDYDVLASDATTAWFAYTDSRRGSGCAAVDDYQRFLVASGVVVPEERHAPASHDAASGEKPAPGDHCAANFGDTDIVVARITP